VVSRDFCAILEIAGAQRAGDTPGRISRDDFQMRGLAFLGRLSANAVPVATASVAKSERVRSREPHHLLLEHV
jgi:hypothetical protein